MHLSLSGIAPLVIYLGAIAAFLLSLFWKPEISLYYLVPLLPMQTVRYWLHDLPSGEKLVDVLLLGAMLGMFFRKQRPIFVWSPLNKIVIIFSAVLYLSLWQGAFYLGGALPLSIADPRFSDWKNYVEMMSLFFVAASVIRTRKQMVIVLLLMSISIFAVNRSFYTTVHGRDFSQYSDSVREAGALGYAGENGMGAFQAGITVFLLGLGAYAKNFLQKATIWGLAGTSLYCLIFAFSRGAYLGFLVGLLVLGLVKERKYLIVLLVILVSWQSFVPGAVSERVLMTYSKGAGLDESAQERVDIWTDALLVIEHSPIVGTGFDTYKFMGRVGPYTDTHNYYLKITLELGFLGLFLFLWLLLTAGKMAWTLLSRANDPLLSAIGCGLFAMLICSVIVNLFGDRWSFLQVTGFFWVILGLAARGLNILKEEEKIPEQEQAPATGETQAEAPRKNGVRMPYPLRWAQDDGGEKLPHSVRVGSPRTKF